MRPWAWFSHHGGVPGLLAVKPQPAAPCGQTEECPGEEEARATHSGTRQASVPFPLCSLPPGDSPSLCLLPPSIKVWSWLCLWLLHRSVLTITASGLCLEVIGTCACINPRNFLLCNAIQPNIFRNLTVKMSTPQSCGMLWRAGKPS